MSSWSSPHSALSATSRWTQGPWTCRCLLLYTVEVYIWQLGGFYAANLAVTKGYPKTAENDGYIVALLDELNEVSFLGSRIL